MGNPTKYTDHFHRKVIIYYLTDQSDERTHYDLREDVHCDWFGFPAWYYAQPVVPGEKPLTQEQTKKTKPVRDRQHFYVNHFWKLRNYGTASHYPTLLRQVVEELRGPPCLIRNKRINEVNRLLGLRLVRSDFQNTRHGQPQAMAHQQPPVGYVYQPQQPPNAFPPI